MRRSSVCGDDKGAVTPQTAEVIDQLLELLAPRLRYDSDEAFFATSVRAATDPGPPAANLAYVNVLRVPPDGEIAAATDPDLAKVPLSLELLGDRAGTGSSRDEWIDISYSPDGTVRGLSDHHAVAANIYRAFSLVAYGRSVLDESDGKLWLQYWLYYYYDDKSVFGKHIEDHEGDWEWVQYRFSDRAHALIDQGHSASELALQLGGEPDDLIDAVTYSGHDKPVKARWNQIARVTSPSGSGFSAPVVFVARGSHANYVGRRGRIFDRTDGKIGPLTPAVEKISTVPPWLRWEGRWGSLKAPRGPYGRLAWTSPSRYHAEEADDWTDVGVQLLRLLEDDTLDPPTISASTVSEDAIAVTYSVSIAVFETLVEGDHEAVARVSVRRLGAGLPARVSVGTLTAPSGLLEVRLPTGAGPLVVQCSLIAEGGTATETAELQLNAAAMEHTAPSGS
jgi:hypothetical protein